MVQCEWIKNVCKRETSKILKAANFVVATYINVLVPSQRTLVLVLVLPALYHVYAMMPIGNTFFNVLQNRGRTTFTQMCNVRTEQK